jgi:hypothetical protein
MALSGSFSASITAERVFGSHYYNAAIIETSYRSFAMMPVRVIFRMYIVRLEVTRANIYIYINI